ncbi:hypothetical protein Pelo_16106 [Pelomyxa schiedti]|nr:hypothetical protein Pelo_16106 [Pelomyxa schiedti]
MAARHQHASEVAREFCRASAGIFAPICASVRLQVTGLQQAAFRTQEMTPLGPGEIPTDRTLDAFPTNASVAPRRPNVSVYLTGAAGMIKAFGTYIQDTQVTAVDCPAAFSFLDTMVINCEHKDFYSPDGAPDRAKVFSTIVHEYFHTQSFQGRGLQPFVNQFRSEDDPTQLHHVDEAVTDLCAYLSFSALVERLSILRGMSYKSAYVCPGNATLALPHPWEITGNPARYPPTCGWLSLILAIGDLKDERRSICSQYFRGVAPENQGRQYCPSIKEESTQLLLLNFYPGGVISECISLAEQKKHSRFVKEPSGRMYTLEVDITICELKENFVGLIDEPQRMKVNLALASDSLPGLTEHCNITTQGFDKNTIIHFHMHSRTGAIVIQKNWTKYPIENEVLLSCYNVYRIISIDSSITSIKGSVMISAEIINRQTSASFVIASSLFLGGFSQLVASVMEFVKGNTQCGHIWMAGKAVSEAVGPGTMALFFLLWAILAGGLYLGVVRHSVEKNFLWLSIVITFILVAVAYLLFQIRYCLFCKPIQV